MNTIKSSVAVSIKTEMEQSLKDLKSSITVNSKKKKISKPKLIFLIVGAIVLIIILYFIISFAAYKIRITDPLQAAADAEYEIGDPQNGAQNYKKAVEINDRKADLTLYVSTRLFNSSGFVLRLKDPIDINGSSYDISVDYIPGIMLFEEKLYFGWTHSSSSHSSASYGVEIDKNGEPTGKDYESLSYSDKQLLKEMKPYYMPMLEYIKNEYNRLMDKYR